MYITVPLALFWACSPSQSELAAKKIKASEAYLAKGDTAKTLLCLDSISKYYPEAIAEKQKAIQLSNQIYNFQLTKQQNSLEIANTSIKSLLKEFKTEKGEFEKYSTYIPNRQVFDKSWSRSFVQVYLNEKGDLTLASNYYGSQWLNHTSLTITGEGQTMKTDSVPLDNINNHHSDFGESRWEKVSYKGNQANLVIKMIALNQDKKLKAIFSGSARKTYIMWLEDYDKQAVKNAWELSKAFRMKSDAEKLIPELEKKIKS